MLDWGWTIKSHNFSWFIGEELEIHVIIGEGKRLWCKLVIELILFGLSLIGERIESERFSVIVKYVFEK